MGLQLMRRLVDDVRVSSTDAGTTVRLLVALPDGRPPAR
jgi:anti-sigma regulatory factor (Ser/Thr protein kinase)